MKLSKDLREFIALLSSRRIYFLLVGGHAVAHHGLPRYTEDIDFLIEVSPENSRRVAEAVQDFGTQLGRAPKPDRPADFDLGCFFRGRVEHEN